MYNLAVDEFIRRVKSLGSGDYVCVFDTKYSYTDTWNRHIVIATVDSCDGICWSNDWYEGETFIRIHDIIPIELLLERWYDYEKEKED